MNESWTKKQHIVPSTYLRYFVNDKENDRMFTSGTFIEYNQKGKTRYKIVYNSSDSPKGFVKKMWYYETMDKYRKILENKNVVEKHLASIENNYHKLMKPIYNIGNGGNLKDIPEESIRYCYHFFAVLLLRTPFFINLLENTATMFAEKEKAEDVENAGCIISKKAFTQMIMREDLGEQLRKICNSITIYLAPEGKCFFTNDNPVIIDCYTPYPQCTVPISPKIAIKFHKTPKTKLSVKTIGLRHINIINRNIIINTKDKFLLPCGKIKEKELVNRAHKQRRKIKSRKSSLYDEKTVAKLLFAFSINDQKEFESILESGNFTREEKMIAKFWSIVIKQTIDRYSKI
jgi:hypothetical protein